MAKKKSTNKSKSNSALVFVKGVAVLSINIPLAFLWIIFALAISSAFSINAGIILLVTVGLGAYADLRLTRYFLELIEFPDKYIRRISLLSIVALLIPFILMAI